ncbi:MAG: hypothetical protein HYV53_02855 [Parcubacteria group bacterium]|nr:hypothetical protein [Parcubacteria group bacterium]
MELKEFILLLAKNKATMFFVVFIFLILALILTVIQPFKYGANSRVLVIQNFSNPDPYLAAKSTEYLSNVLAKVIYSNSFFDNVLSSGYFINKNYFGQTVKGQMKIWHKTVSAKAVNDSGIIAINVYHKDRPQAELINRAVIYTLQAKHGLYHGGGNSAAIKVIDQPITSNYPVQPNLILNFGLALALGLVFALTYIYLFPEEKYNIKLAPKFAARVTRAGLLEKSALAPATLEPDYKLSENFNKINDNDYDDLDIHEEIIQRGSMKNIFGKPF